jgi:molybdate transport system substrate-binding protein
VLGRVTMPGGDAPEALAGRSTSGMRSVTPDQFQSKVLSVMKCARRSLLCGGFIVAAVVYGVAWAQSPDALYVFSSNGLRVPLEEFRSDIEQRVGRPVLFEFSTAHTLADRIEAGNRFDVAILTPVLMDELIAHHKIQSRSRAEVARVGIGVGAQAGAAARNIKTLDNLREVLLNAESVAYGADGQSRRTNEASFEALGIQAEMQDKIRLTGPGEAPTLVARGEVDLVMTLVSELVRAPGVEYLGPLPAEVQSYVRFEAGIGSAARDRNAAGALIAFLAEPAFMAALKAHGLEAVGP